MRSQIISARAKTFSNTLPGSRLTLILMRQWGEKVNDVSRSCATGEWKFEHCEAFLTPLGGIAVDLSPNGYAYPTP